jgi:hypothetical protein
MQSSAARLSRGPLLCAAILLLMFSSPAAAQAGKPTEYQVKAAYLFNFGKFVKWPEQTSSEHDTFSICVLGSDPFGKVLDVTVSGEQIDGRKARVRRLASAADANGCRILFVSRSEEGRLGSVLATLGRSPVLTVSDIDGFANRDGMIQFVMDRDRVRFQVNLAATQKAGLSLSSELLKVATAVKGPAGD